MKKKNGKEKQREKMIEKRKKIGKRREKMIVNGYGSVVCVCVYVCVYVCVCELPSGVHTILIKPPSP